MASLEILTPNKYLKECVRIKGRYHFPRANCSLMGTARPLVLWPLAWRAVHPCLQMGTLGCGVYASPHREDGAPIVSRRLVFPFTLHQTRQLSPQGHTWPHQILLPYASIFKNHTMYITIHQFRNTFFHAPTS